MSWVDTHSGRRTNQGRLQVVHELIIDALETRDYPYYIDALERSTRLTDVLSQPPTMRIWNPQQVKCLEFSGFRHCTVHHKLKAKLGTGRRYNRRMGIGKPRERKSTAFPGLF